MVKLIYCLRRRSEVAPEEFHRYWLEHHAPLVKSHAAALGIRRYVQSHTAPEWNDALAASRNAAEAYDGVAELWYDSFDALSAAVATDEGRAAGKELYEDEAHFIDFGQSSIFMAEEHEIITPANPFSAR